VSRGKAAKKKARPGVHPHKLTLLVLVVIAVFIGFKFGTSGSSTPSASGSSNANTAASLSSDKSNHCATNTLAQFVVVSIGQRRMWACQGKQAVYTSPVVTGMQNLAADLTPTGTYHVYAKQADVTLTGSDTTGNWSDPVHYWMPFLDNQYGTYGFHDATWRSNSAFGNISPASSDASHGCVELPLGAAQWLYGWIQVGATVTIED